MLVLTDLVSLICLFDFWLHACRLFWRDPKLFPAFLSFWNWFIYILMHIPSQTESPLFLATKAVRGLLCPSLLLLLRSLSRVPRAQKPWIRPWRRYLISISIFYLFYFSQKHNLKCHVDLSLCHVMFLKIFFKKKIYIYIYIYMKCDTFLETLFIYLSFHLNKIYIYIIH